MLRVAVIAASLLALALPLDARAGDLFRFEKASAPPNDRVVVHAKTPRPVRLYLVPQAAAPRVFARSDRRLSFVGVLVPRRDRGTLAFSVPPLDEGAYVLATWCRTCGDGRFRVQRTARLQIETPAGCPVTVPNSSRPPGQPRNMSWYGNGLLWAGLAPGGTYAVSPDRVDADGSIFNKVPWVTTPPWEKPTISGERIDAAAPPLRVIGVNTGSFSGAANASHMSAIRFPTAGCWRLRARLGDISLVYVVRVVVEAP